MGHRHCCCGCTYFSDTFDRDDGDPGDPWTKVAGDGAIASNRLCMSAANSLWICNAAPPGDTKNLVIHVNLATTPWGGQAMVAFDYVDADNYWYLRFEFSSVIYARLHRVVAGVDSEVAATASSRTAEDLGYYGVWVMLCLTSDMIHLFMQAGYPDLPTGLYGGPLIWYPREPASATIGLGTRAVAGQQCFDYLELQYEHEDRSTCDECRVCAYCADGHFPDTMLLTLAGFPADCAGFNDDYELAANLSDPQCTRNYGGGGRSIYCFPQWDGTESNVRIVVTITFGIYGDVVTLATRWIPADEFLCRQFSNEPLSFVSAVPSTPPSTLCIQDDLTGVSGTISSGP